MLCLKHAHKCSWCGVLLYAGADAVFLSCHLLHRVRMAYTVKVLDTLFVQGLRGDIMSIEAQAFSSTLGNKEHLKNENRLELVGRL